MTLEGKKFHLNISGDNIIESFAFYSLFNSFQIIHFRPKEN